MEKTAYIFEGYKDLTWSSHKSDPLVFRKQLLYEGKIGQGDKTHVISEADIDEFVLSTNAMIADGFTPSLPLEHTEEPDKNRGKILKLEKAKDPSGRSSLYGVVKFRDAEAAKMAKSTDVSVYIPPEFRGNGKTYRRPVRHVALTTNPAVPSLGAFETVKFSLTGNSMSRIITLAQKLGLTIPEGATEDAVQVLLENAFATRGDTSSPDGSEGEQEVVNGAMLSLLRDNRKAKLDALVLSKRLAPKVRDSIAADHISDEALTLSLTTDTKAFDQIIAALEANTPMNIPTEERTGSQAIELSGPDVFDPEKNPLVADAESRKDS